MVHTIVYVACNISVFVLSMLVRLPKYHHRYRQVQEQRRQVSSQTSKDQAGIYFCTSLYQPLKCDVANVALSLTIGLVSYGECDCSDNTLKARS